MNKKIAISIAVFVIIFSVFIAFISFHSLNDYDLTSTAEDNENIENNLQKDEKYNYYNLLINKLDYLKYGNEDNDYFEYNQNFTGEMKDKILNFDVDKALDNMENVDNISIYELNNDGSKNKLKIYADKEDKAYAILKNNTHTQYYLRDNIKTDKNKDIVNEIENKTNLFYCNELPSKNSETKLCFRNLEMNLIVNTKMSTIYSPDYKDLCFECDNLPLQIIYTIKDNKIIKKEFMYIDIDNKPLEEYKLDKNGFLTTSDYTNFKATYLNQRDFENAKFNGNFNFAEGYTCYDISIEE